MVPPFVVAPPLVLDLLLAKDGSVILVPHTVVVPPLVGISSFVVVVAALLNIVSLDSHIHLSRITRLTTLPDYDQAWHTRTCTHSETRLY